MKDLNNSLLIIAGGGKFGKKGVEYAKKHGYSALLIDSNPDCYASKYATVMINDLKEIDLLKPGELGFLVSDVNIINDIIEKYTIDIIIPVVPIHLMAVIIQNFFATISVSLLPNPELTQQYLLTLKKELILGHNIEKGIIFLSYARGDELCPENCSGPIDFCPNFKREKPITITEYIKSFLEIKNNLEIRSKDNINLQIALESKQLVSGLGGIFGTDIKSIFDILRKNITILKEKNIQLTVATTCNCHGVLNILKRN